MRTLLVGQFLCAAPAGQLCLTEQVTRCHLASLAILGQTGIELHARCGVFVVLPAALVPHLAQVAADGRIVGGRVQRLLERLPARLATALRILLVGLTQELRRRAILVRIGPACGEARRCAGHE
jgi:hypothetical protein